MNILEVINVSKSFFGVEAVCGVSIRAQKGDIIGLIGPNGAGKTTLFNLITGIYPLDSGQVLLKEQDITGKPQHEITRAGIGRTFQNIRLFTGLNVLENVMTAHDPCVRYSLLDSLLGTPKRRRLDSENRERSMRYLEMTGIARYAAQNPGSLPYGVQRKLEIARALSTEPSVLLLDEPGAGLNPAEIVDLIELIGRLNRELDLTILLIDHRMKLIMELSRYIHVLNFGRMLAEGTPAEIQRNVEVGKAYMGEEE